MSKEINKNLFSSNTALDNLEPNDCTVEVIGYVDRIIGRHTVGAIVKYEIFKFFINNASGKTIQTVAWGNNIAKVEDLFTVNSVVHIDGAKSKLPREAKWNGGNVRCELIIQSTTEINVLGLYTQIPLIFEPIAVDIQNTFNIQGSLTVQGYVKTVFAKLSYQHTIIGSITDGIYKLVIRLNFIDELIFVKGELISATGVIKRYRKGPPFLLVGDIANIKKLDGAKMEFKCLLDGYNIPL